MKIVGLGPEISILDGEWVWCYAAFAAMKFRIFSYWIAQSSCESLSGNEAGSGGCKPGLGQTDVCLNNSWLAPFPEMPDLTRNEDMSCPEKRDCASADYTSEGFAPVWRPVPCRVHVSKVPQFMRCGRQKAQRCCHRITRRAVCCSLTRSNPTIPRGSAAPHSPSQLLRVSALRRLSWATASAFRTLHGIPGPLTLTPKRVSNVQQNAHRRLASRRNPGGRRSR